jgi:hypothetical protein
VEHRCYYINVAISEVSSSRQSHIQTWEFTIIRGRSLSSSLRSSVISAQLNRVAEHRSMSLFQLLDMFPFPSNRLRHFILRSFNEVLPGKATGS